jgi:hypothetical protein
MAPHNQPPRIAVIACAVMETEVDHYIAEMDHIVHLEYLEQGLHNEPDRLRTELQKMIDRIEHDTDAEAIVLVYGLCGRGTEGVTTSRCQLVIARAHDCITLLLGDKDRYAAYVKQCPGTYWYSPGWNRHHLPPGKERHDKLLKEYTEAYGEENAHDLMETEQQWFKTYGRAAYVHLNVGKTDKDVAFTKQCADWLDWQYDEQQGDPQLLIDLLAGNWDEQRFVVLEPGRPFELVPDERVIEPADPPEES